MTIPAAVTDAPAPEAEPQAQGGTDPQPDATPPPAGTDDSGTQSDNDADDQDDAEPDDGGSDKSRAARQAAKYRVQLKEARDEIAGLRDEMVGLRAAMSTQGWAIVEAEAVAAGFDPKLRTLIENSGVELDSLLADDGIVINHDKVREAIRTTASAFEIRPKPPRPAPTPGQGQGNGMGAVPGWNTLLGDAAKGRG